MMKKLIIILFLSTCLTSAKAQRINTFGVAALYNFQSTGIGFDARALVNVYGKLFLIPRISYYPGFNKYKEWYGGADLSYFLYKKKKYNPYAFVGVYYNQWLNSNEFPGDKATRNNIGIEPGIGFLYKKRCLTPFAEARFNTKWKEFTIGVGVLIKFGECFNMGGFSQGAKKGKGGFIDCPTF